MKLLTVFSLAALASMAFAAPTLDCQETYKVQGREKCYKIAKQHGIKTSQLKKLNPFINGPCTNLRAGNVLCIRGSIAVSRGSSNATQLKKGQCYSNDDCPGEKCCNLFTNQCINDPKNNICHIIPPTESKEAAAANTPVDLDGKNPFKDIDEEDDGTALTRRDIDLDGKNPFKDIDEEDEETTNVNTPIDFDGKNPFKNIDEED